MSPALATIVRTNDVVQDDAFPPPPDMGIYSGMLSKEECDELIDLSNDIGWNMRVDSIDHYKKPSVDIYVYDRQEVMNERAWAWLSLGCPR